MKFQYKSVLLKICNFYTEQFSTMGMFSGAVFSLFSNLHGAFSIVF